MYDGGEAGAGTVAEAAVFGAIAFVLSNDGMKLPK